MHSGDGELKALKVLIADDSRPLRATLCSFLRKLGISSMTAVSDGAEARDLLGKEEFDLFLVDQDMPGLSGLELLTTIREVKPALKIIMVTSAGDARTVAAAIEQGCDGYIIKPVSLGVLEKKIRQAFRAQPGRDALLKDLRLRIRDVKSREDWEEVLGILRDAMGQESRDRELLMLSGEVHEKLQKDEEALKCYGRAAELSRELLPGPLEGMARVLARRGELKEAIAAMGKAIKVSHESVLGPRMLFYAELLEKDGQTEAAAAVARQLAERPSALAKAARAQLGRLERADSRSLINVVPGMGGK